MQREHLKCVCICVCMSIPREESIMNNRTEAAWESVNTELFACLRVLLCVQRQNGSIFYVRTYCFALCVCVCVRLAVIHWPDSSSWGSAHIPVITAGPTADWLLSALLPRCQSVRQSHCWFPAKVNTLEWCWQCWLAIDDLWSPFYCHIFTPQSYWPTCGIRILNHRVIVHSGAALRGRSQ